MTPDEVGTRLGGTATMSGGGDHARVTVDVPVADWVTAVQRARDELGYDFFDWLSAVDELDQGFTVVTHLWSVPRRRLVRAGDARDVRHRLPRPSRRPAPAAAAAGVRGVPAAEGVRPRGPGRQDLARCQGARRVRVRRRQAHPDAPARGTGPGGMGTGMIEVAIRVVAVVAAFLTVPLIVGQTEHKVMAHMQGRLGPMYAGAFHGWAQLIADGVKFVQKEDVAPRAVDRPVFRMAPIIALVPYLVALLFIPLGPHDWLVGQPLDVGLFVVLAVVGVGVVAVLMAAWSSANKYSLLGGLRAAAQLLGYELPFVLAAASVAMAAG